MYTPDRQINPPDFYKKDSEFSNDEIREKIKELYKEQQTKYDFAYSFSSVYNKAKERIECIKRSKAIPYEVAGGYFARQKDLLKAEKAFNWVNSTIDRLEKYCDEIQEQIDELEKQID